MHLQHSRMTGSKEEGSEAENRRTDRKGVVIVGLAE